MKRNIIKTTLILAALLANMACEPETGAMGAGSYPKSSALAISKDGKTLFVALADHDKIVAINAKNGNSVAELPIQGYPHRLTLLKDNRLAVTSRYAGTLNVLSTDLKKIDATIEVGADPFEVIETDQHLVVALSGQSQLARIPLDKADHVEDRIELEQKNPRGLALLANGELFVSHFLQSSLSTVDLNSGVATEQIPLNMDNNPHFEANQLETITVSPDQTEVVLPHVECNNDPKQFEGGDTFAQTLPYYAEGATGYPAVVPSVSRVDIQDKVHLNQGPGEYVFPEFGETPPEKVGMVSGILNPLENNRLRETRVNTPVAVALANNGELELIVNKGSGNVIIRRSVIEKGQQAILAEVEIGIGASDIVLSPDGRTAYVYNEFTYEITSFEVPVTDQNLKGSKLQDHVDSESWKGINDTRAPILEAEAHYKVAQSVLPANIERGRILFNSIDEKMTLNGSISCATCHPGGMADGTTWNFAQGKRQTPALWGGIMDTAPFHWEGDLDGLQGLNSFTLQTRMGGTGLSRSELNELAAFIDTIPVPASDVSKNSDKIAIGEDIFYSEETGCMTCHAGSHFTDGKDHNVGTGINTTTALEKANHFATPVLHGLVHSAPYFHDGRSATMQDLVEKYVATDKMGKGSHLDRAQLEALTAYLESL